jgi:hypothetical protein
VGFVGAGGGGGRPGGRPPPPPAPCAAKRSLASLSMTGHGFFTKMFFGINPCTPTVPSTSSVMLKSTATLESI